MKQKESQNFISLVGWRYFNIQGFCGLVVLIFLSSCNQKAPELEDSSIEAEQIVTLNADDLPVIVVVRDGTDLFAVTRHTNACTHCSFILTYFLPCASKIEAPLRVVYHVVFLCRVQFIDFSHSFFFPSLLILAFVKLKDLSLSRECQRHGKVKKGSFLLLSNFSLGDKARKNRFLDLNPVGMTFFLVTLSSWPL